MALNLLLPHSSPCYCISRLVAQARNLDSSLCSHPSTKPSAIPSSVPSKHLTTYLLHAASRSGPPSPVTWLSAVSLSSASTLVSLSHPHSSPLPGDSHQSNPTEAKKDHVLPLLETLQWPPTPLKAKATVLTMSAKPYVISPCYFSPIIPSLSPLQSYCVCSFNILSVLLPLDFCTGCSPECKALPLLWST